MNLMLKPITVTVDRPMGSYHPDHADLYYPINYGYIDGIIAPDGEEQDAYVLGVHEPVKTFTGKCIAVIHRMNDIEDKWVIASENSVFSKEDIEKQVSFQEQYFNYEIEMINDIKWLFFDMGSTLVDEMECYKSRIDKIVSHSGIKKEVFVNKVYEFAKTNDCAVKSAAEYFGVAVPKWNSELECLYPNVENILQTLSKKYKLGIIANQSLGSEKRLKNWGIYEYFEVIVASAEAGCAKPDLRIFEIALEKANCKPSDAVMIGDRLDNDIVPAKKLGMKTIWVKQGFAKFQNIHQGAEQPDCIIKNINDLLNI